MNYIAISGLIIGTISLAISIKGIFTHRKIRKDIINAQKDVKEIKEDTGWLHDIGLEEHTAKLKKQLAELMTRDGHKN